VTGPTVTELDFAVLQDLKESLPRLAHKPLAHLSYLTAGQVEAYWLDEIAQDLADESSLAFVSRRSGCIDGLALCIDSPWDTQAVMRRIAIVKHLAHANNASDSKALDDLLTEVTLRAARRGVECLTCKVQARNPAVIRALERQGFLLMDTLLDLVFDSSRTPLENIRLPSRPEHLHTRLARPEDPPEILALAHKAFANYFGRYHSDPKMPPGTGAKVYDQWVCSGFEGWADWTVVAEIDGQIVGYSMWKNASALETKHGVDITHCNFGAIHPNFSGRGVYTALKLAGMRIAESFAKHFDLATHIANYPVHRSTARLGWRIAGARHSFHKWLSD
jgi:ribosomal protein S18 acetylase RimI-like enzyme